MDVRGWTADQHKQAGDELLAQAHGALDEECGDATEMIERVEASAGHLAAVATAHYAAAQLIQTRLHRSGYQGDEAKHAGWNR